MNFSLILKNESFKFMSLLTKFFDKIIKKKLLYVRLSKNSIEIKEVHTGKSISRKALVHYSNERLIIADFLEAEKFFREVIDELLNQKHKTFKKSLSVVLQIVDDQIKSSTVVEQRIYADAFEHAGAAYYWFVEHQNLLSNEEIIEIANRK